MTINKILADLVSVNSSFPNERNVALHIERYLRNNGFITRRQYLQHGRFNLFAEKGKGKEAIMFYGHMDTVPLYGKWDNDPFTLRESRGRLYGLGAEDMKGGIAAILESTKNADKKVKLLFCVDEENISEGAWKAILKKDWFKDTLFMIVAEPGTSNRSQGGVNFPTLGRRGRCVFSIDVQGRSAHGAAPEKGSSALEAAAKIAINISKIRLRKHKKLGKESLFVNKIESASTSLSVPDKAHLELDVHIVPPSTIDGIKKRIERFLAALKDRGILDQSIEIKVNVNKRKTPYLEPYVTNTNNKNIGKIIKIIKKRFGNVRLNYGSSVADENVFANNLKVPVITIGAMGSNGHSQNEWVSEKSLNELTELYKLITNSF